MTITSGADPLATPPTAEYPSAEQSFQAARKLMGITRGKVKIVRRFASVGIPMWRVEASLTRRDGPDYELEVDGDSLDEVAYALVDALETCGLRIDEAE